MQIIAHRGYSGKYEENSVSAFNGAIQAGITFIETDVQECLDGLIIHHNYYSKSIRKKISKLTLGEARSFNMVTLSEFLTLTMDINVILDLKQEGDNPEFIKGVVSEVNKSNHQNVTIASFNEHHVRQLCAYPKRSFKIGLITSSTILYNYDAFELDCLIICSQQVTAKLIQDVKIPVFTFTINDLREYQRVKAMGVSGIITDYPVEMSQSQ